MKILQIIDSLHAGGAERMAVTYANLLQKKGIDSFLCCTREEGLLKDSIDSGVGYVFLEKKSALDLKAVFRLKKFIADHQIEIVHAHGTSFFTATIQKILRPKLKLVWHDHNGERPSQLKSSNRILFYSSTFFDSIISVNPELQKWAKKNLKTKKNYYLPNFVRAFKVTQKENSSLNKLICLANLREPKNHFILVKAFKKVNESFPNIELLLVGADYHDTYSKELKELIAAENLHDQVMILGKQKNILELLKQADLGILSSDSEGLPMALLEYGQVGLPVVCTRVGQCEEVVGTYGKLVTAGDVAGLANAILEYLKSPDEMRKDAALFQRRVNTNYTENAIFPKLQEIYENL
ncbi:MAG TPA: glycosyltransferase [Salinimicrobium sp.]|nr:glycosyltransferase [Salinimicrobium sp.]